ncbi:D-amino acid dehydrogenase [Cupriavidus plantarum]|uniref:Glycine/D-amino acid oxidase-like deaminating enzyme n=1 Tax=Cupriavidus plantarum TaxID=942865 RepID=A0A316EY37_9BURK|nr:D-amino acid dehydrogenase [Cupriavidus plantarum]NYH99939.1 D-amino-acid dehydrogenase [Cupriavidus plantarum]PWK37136.1 glycine/D-amino acid oxidase-like deaminating enzyme [Cupriavidus plantarum]REF02125.1 glycine/D-amino acid oxidase-like deaminating enzyme [Cupriavidus plantarum]RLK45027.1 glycine/D-amino acid oxidase-like deaminating enzyme [Cupriavidus plantarum]CAG2130002.1 D-amino acid dehydrogenase 1 [Cupriavidus plantarum]
MHVIVIGAGAIGVCSAWYLRQAGFDVTVLEARGAPAQESSFGNAGVIAPGYVTPWAAPGMPRKLLGMLLAKESPVRFRPSLDPAMWRWIARWVRECHPDRYRANKLRMQRLAFYSRDCLHRLRGELEIDYEQSRGYLQLFRTSQDLDLAAPALALLRENKVPHTLVDAAGCRRIEPGLAQDTALAGGLHLPEDESGNCPLFVRRLHQHAEAAGVRFRFDTVVARVRAASGGRVASPAGGTASVAAGSLTVELAPAKRGATPEALHADRVLICAGASSATLMRPLGLRIPLYPVKGYSATVMVRDELQAPLAALMDESYKVAITRMGNRLRVAGTAELGTRRLDLRQDAIRTLIRVARDWFPVAGSYQEATLWAGARPMLPDGPPLIGATSVPGLFLNLGHGSTGWAMSCGSGKIAADQIAASAGEGDGPAIDMEGLTPARYGLA